MFLRPFLILAALPFALGVLSPPAHAQEDRAGGEDRAVRGAGELYVPADHWIGGVLSWLDAFPELGEVVPSGFGTVPRGEVLAVLDAALEADLSPEAHRLVRAYRDRFEEEVGEGGARGPAGPVRWGGGHLELLGGGGSEVLAAGAYGEGIFPPEPPTSRGEPDALAGSAGGALALGPVAVAGGLGTDAAGTLRVRELYAAGAVGPLRIWAGRRAPAFGGSTSGAVVLSGRVPLDGGGFGLARPITLPWVLRYMGPVRFENHLARFDESGQVDSPFFWTARGSFTPHPRVTLGVNRGAIFGGDPAPAITLRNVLGDLIGARRSEADDEFGRTDFSNQVVAGEARVRVLTGSVPLTAYFEWGAEDSAGAWKNVPGIIAGVHAAALPGAPGVSVGLERTHFAPHCCGNPRWYRHARFTGGWADGGIPLGHPIGGHGGEWLLYGRADLMDARLRSSWRLFHRFRGVENLFAPDRQGRSLGGSLRVQYRILPWMDLTADGFLERGFRGADWTDGRAFVGVRALF